jgi:hypothetical protein
MRVAAAAMLLGVVNAGAPNPMGALQLRAQWQRAWPLRAPDFSLPVIITHAALRRAAAGKQIPGPANMQPATVAAWHKNMHLWRDAYKKTTSYSDKIYSDPQLKWTQTSYMQPQMHPYDRYFYDPVAHKYTVQKWLDDVNKRYGGVDSILMWPTYGLLGIISCLTPSICDRLGSIKLRHVLQSTKYLQSTSTGSNLTQICGKFDPSGQVHEHWHG